MYLRFRKLLIFLLLGLQLAACGNETSLPHETITPPAKNTPLALATTVTVATLPGRITSPPTTNGVIAVTGGVNVAAPVATNSLTTSAALPDSKLAGAIGHPRLWLTEQDLPRLRSWAVSSNSLYRDSLLPVATRSKEEMDSGLVPRSDSGDRAYEEYPTEMYAELFAFMSLVSNNPAEREDYAKRARTLLLHVINQAAMGADEEKPFRHPEFSTHDRSRWHGEAFALTVDWIYPYLSTADKQVIRKVFLRWAEEIGQGAITGHDHPQLTGKLNDPALVQDKREVRWSGNNYWTAHMRNLGLMALAFDPADDPDNKLRDYLGNATGAWLYVFDHLLRNEAKGGILPEGFEYSPQTASYALQFLLALQTAGQADPTKWGQQVVLGNNPFWADFVAGYLHSLSPTTVTHPELGPVYQPAWFGSGLKYWAGDSVSAFGSLGLYAGYTSNSTLLADMRWIQANLAPGGPQGLANRLTSTTFYQEVILSFMLFDPASPPPPDPRPRLALSFFAVGLGRVLSRTSWDKNASWFTYKLSWNSLDHQHGDGNQFEFYRKGEWLTKERTGYDLDYGSSDNHNTLAIENTPPDRNDPDDYRNLNWKRGSQWAHVATGNPLYVARSSSPDFEYITGDATALYNSEREGSVEVNHASRSIFWLKPDYIFIYDRVETKKDGGFKRFWLNLAQLPVIEGKETRLTTPGGQQLNITTLLPANALLSAEANPEPPLAGEIAEQEPMKFRLKVEAPGGPKSTRFLHVLQAADNTGKLAGAGLVQSTRGTAYVGALAENRVVLFAVDLGTTFSELTYSVPATITEHYITGLAPGAPYKVSVSKTSSNVLLTISLGGNYQSDSGGVLFLKNPA